MDRFLLWIVLGVSVTAPSFALEIRVTPSSPTASSEVLVTVSGMTPATNYQIYDTDLRIDGADIWLDLYWQAPGMGGQAFWPYEHRESLGTFSPGTYTVHVTNKGARSDSGTATFAVLEVADAPEIVPADPVPVDPDPLNLLDPLGWIGDWTATPTLNLPGFEVKHIPLSDVGGAKDGISELRIEPTWPASSDEVRVSISGWKPSADLDVERTTLQIEGNEIWLDLYWHTQPPLPVAPGPYGFALDPDSFMSAQSMQPVIPVQVDVAPYDGMPFVYIKSLGVLSPGTYTLHVTNHSPMTGSASISFTVAPPIGVGSQPSWWQSLFQGTD